MENPRPSTITLRPKEASYRSGGTAAPPESKVKGETDLARILPRRLTPMALPSSITDVTI